MGFGVLNKTDPISHIKIIGTEQFKICTDEFSHPSTGTDESYNGRKSSHGSPPPEYSEKTTLDLDNTNRSIETYLESTP